jgi:uncharacterized RmlC-like cupin family protein
LKSEKDWRNEGVRVIKSDRLDKNTPQTPGMQRAAAVNFARVGSQKLWAGTVIIQPNAKTGAHHHGALESVIYVVRGAARMRWGDWSSRRRRMPAILFSYRPTCRTKKSMR